MKCQEIMTNASVSGEKRPENIYIEQPGIRFLINLLSKQTATDSAVDNLSMQQ